MHVSPLSISALLWVAFIVYWTRAARNSAPTLGAESVKSRQGHQLLMHGALFFALVGFPPFDRRWLPSWPALVPVGLAIQTASAAPAIWARKHLGQNWSAAITTKQEHQLVRSGPYRLVRHPSTAGCTACCWAPPWCPAPCTD